jgi:hypothetical protein
MKRILMVTAVAALLSDVATAQSFDRNEVLSLPDAMGHSYWVDMDGDGDFDIFRVSEGDVTLFLSANENYHPIVVAAENLGFKENRVAFRDYDGDGDLDILASHGNSLAVFNYEAPGTFALVETGIEFYEIDYGDIHWLDVDGDLDLDVIHGRKIFQYDGGAYVESGVVLPDSWLKPTWGDINGDGLIDAVVGYGSEAHSVSEVRVCINRGNGNFDFVGVVLPHKNYLPGSLALIDADRDSDLDIFAVDSYGQAWLYKNTPTSSDGSIALTEIQIAYPVDAVVPMVGDLNADGLEDLVLKSNLSFQVLINTSSGESISFTGSTLEINLDQINSAYLVDVDGDNDLDIHVAGFTYETGIANILYTNLEVNAGVVPEPPSNLSAAVAKDITLTWTSMPGMVYNIELTRNGSSYWPSQTSSAGKLFVPGTESFPRSGKMIVNGLPAGTYQCRIQAVSPSGRVSAFSSADFEVGTAPSELSLEAMALKKVTLCWDYTGSGSPAFAVFRALENEPAIELARLDPGVNCYEDGTIPGAAKFTYFVNAVDGGMHSAHSNTVVHHSSLFVGTDIGKYEPNNIVESRGYVADFDLDGDYDLGFVGRIITTGTSVLMKNDGGRFTPAGTMVPMTDFNVPYLETTGPKDMDNDGDEDLILITGQQYSWQRLNVFINNDGSFVKGYESPEYPGIMQVLAEDLNNDGRVDLLFSHKIGTSTANPYKYEFLVQTRDGQFENSKFIFDDKITTDLATFSCADLNSDGFIDIIWNPGGGNHAEIFANNGGMAFTKISSTLPTGLRTVIGDYTGDGVIDMVVEGNESLSMYVGKGNFTFDESKAIPTGSASSTPYPALVDIDLDGWQDLIFTNGQWTQFLMSNGDGSFTLAESKLPEYRVAAIELTDLENDGDADIVKTGNDGQHQGKNFLYRNQSADIAAVNLPPSAPTSLLATYKDGKAMYTWSRSMDDHTPEKSISYNLSVKDAKGKIWLNAETNELGKFRRRFIGGNAGVSTNYTINNLPAGTYTARVQALDASFALSGWSDDVMVIIADGPTDLVVDRILLNKVNLSWKQSLFAESNVIVERKTIATPWEIVALLPSASTSYIDPDLALNTIYQYRVAEVAGDEFTATSDVAEWSTNLFTFVKTEIANWSGSADVADCTGDGEMEILLNGAMSYSGYPEDITKATFAYSDGTWVKTDITPSGLDYNARITFADLNGDYKLDIFQTGWSSDTGHKAETFINNGDKFRPDANIFTSVPFDVPFFADLDMDNDSDFSAYIAGIYPLVQRVYRNDGNGIYAQIAEASCDPCLFNYAVADFDRDGDDDLLRADGVNGSFKIYYNSPDGFVPGKVTFPGYEMTPQVADYNNDGWPDIVMLTDKTYGSAKIYKNQGSQAGAFPQFTELSVNLGMGSPSMISGDFDHDGRTDLVVPSSNLNVLLNRGDDDFEKIKLTDYSVPLDNSALIDFDNDGDLDILVSGYFSLEYGGISRKATVLVNQIMVSGKGTSNTAPSVPTGLTSVQDEFGMHLTWTPSDDDHTPHEGLTFDVVLYRDGKMISKGALDPATGTRVRLRPGTSSGQATLFNLEEGDYTWRVQAIDASFVGSALSAEGRFTYLPSLTTGAAGAAKETWSVKPNPATVAVTLVEVPPGTMITIYDAKGLLIQQVLHEAGGNRLIDTSHWASGVYLVVGTDGKTRTLKRFVLR